MKFVHLQTILSRRHSGKRKFSQNKGFPTVKGFTKWPLMHMLIGTKNGPQLVIGSVNISGYVCDHVFVDTFYKKDLMVENSYQGVLNIVYKIVPINFPF